MDLKGVVARGLLSPVCKTCYGASPPLFRVCVSLCVFAFMYAGLVEQECPPTEQTWPVPKRVIKAAGNPGVLFSQMAK